MSYADKIKQVDQLQEKIMAHGALSDAVKKKINYKFRLDWNYYSNRMEGGTLTREETRSVMVGNIDVKGKPIKDVMEMNGHDKVVLDILKIGKGDLRIAEKRIKDIHKAIMHEEDIEKAKQIGQWKAQANEIINYKNEKISFTPPDEVAEAMHELLNKTNAELDAFFTGKKSLHPVVIASQFHIGYVTIHPFYDGNGRTARILNNLLLISCGLPPIIIKDAYKQAYNQLLADIQAYGGSPELFYAFICDRIIESQQLVLDAIEGKEIEEPDDIDKRIELLKKRLTNPDVVTESKSLHTTNEVLGKSIFPLLQSLETKLEKLKELFNSTDRRMQYNESGKTHQLGSDESTFEVLQENWLRKRNLATPDLYSEGVDPAGISEFTYTYQFKGYKKTLKLQYVSIYLTFQFNEFDYALRIQNDYQTEKRFGYNHPIDKAVANEIVTGLVDKVLNQIAEASDIKE
jgi:Fic family protein